MVFCEISVGILVHQLLLNCQLYFSLLNRRKHTSVYFLLSFSNLQAMGEEPFEPECSSRIGVSSTRNVDLVDYAADDDHCYLDDIEDEARSSGSFRGFKWKKTIDAGSNKRRRHIDRGEQEHPQRAFMSGPMVGFGLPNETICIVNWRLPDIAEGPPYFYFENVAFVAKGVWENMSRFLYDIEPEFVDSKYLCAAARKRGYIHNLPLHGRVPLLPMPSRTIQNAFPSTRKCWPSWDPRMQLNCMRTCMASGKSAEKIRSALISCRGTPTGAVQKYILDECKRWNLIWVGLNRVATLEPHEVEFLLGFPRDHTRGICKTERCQSLGNSCQVDTVAYHLSVLKELFPNGIRVLSLFSGIGGAEVALHRLGIRMKLVVSAEISKLSQDVLRSWWEQTGQAG